MSKMQQVGSVGLECLQLDSVYCSGESFSWCGQSDKIYYYDSYFCWLYIFDSDGKLSSRKIGYGRGPEESLVRPVIACAMSGTGEFAVNGTTYDYEYFSSDMKLQKRFMLKQEQNSTDPESYMTYTTADSDIAARLYEGKLYMGMTSDKETFSYFTTPGAYISDSYRIGVVDVKNGKALPMEVKGYPSMYNDAPHKYTSFDGVDFDIDSKGNLYVGFRADSLIYVFDKSRNAKYSFGFAGKNMDTDYEKVATMDDIPAYGRNLATKGYYTWVEYIDETGLCFRSYKKGAHSEHDGLQIYDKSGGLMGDCEVPAGFKVTGYISPYYYSQVYNGDDGSLYMYRFEI